MIEIGKVAFIVISGEPVFVLDLKDRDKVFPILSGTVAVVSRTVAGRDGISYVHDEFQIEELESLDEQRARFMAENTKLMEKYGPKAENLPPINPDNGFSSN